MGLNIVGAGLVSTEGDIFFDPVLRLSDAKFEAYTAATSYIRTFELFGKASRVDFRVPYTMGRWEGILNGADVSTRRHGFNDPRVRFSMILMGAPPFKGKEFVEYVRSHPVRTSLGVGLSVTLPLGEYYPDRLINLGGNRYVVRPQMGVLHQHGPWQFEVTGLVSLYTDNSDFFGGTTLEQKPLWFVEGHVIRQFSRGMWGSISGGYSFGGTSHIDGVKTKGDDATRYYAISFGMSVSQQQSVKIAWVNSDTNVVIGSRNNSLILSWSMNWAD
ncbi:MAG TPA: transporter [Xanthomonadales bacterium]|nr:transporter [Xanthomonadales bacterium]